MPTQPPISEDAHSPEGGTALNLSSSTYRASAIDIDLNYIGHA